ncbi:hypothetical protein ACFLYY_02665 [Patescibacteria group bacterium]
MIHLIKKIKKTRGVIAITSRVRGYLRGCEVFLSFALNKQLKYCLLIVVFGLLFSNSVFAVVRPYALPHYYATSGLTYTEVVLADQESDGENNSWLAWYLRPYASSVVYHLYSAPDHSLNIKNMDYVLYSCELEIGDDQSCVIVGYSTGTEAGFGANVFGTSTSDWFGTSIPIYSDPLKSSIWYDEDYTPCYSYQNEYECTHEGYVFLTETGVCSWIGDRCLEAGLAENPDDCWGLEVNLCESSSELCVYAPWRYFIGEIPSDIAYNLVIPYESGCFPLANYSVDAGSCSAERIWNCGSCDTEADCNSATSTDSLSCHWSTSTVWSGECLWGSGTCANNVADLQYCTTMALCEITAGGDWINHMCYSSSTDYFFYDDPSMNVFEEVFGDKVPFAWVFMIQNLVAGFSAIDWDGGEFDDFSITFPAIEELDNATFTIPILDQDMIYQVLSEETWSFIRGFIGFAIWFGFLLSVPARINGITNIRVQTAGSEGDSANNYKINY